MSQSKEHNASLAGVAFRAFDCLSAGLVITRDGRVIYCNYAFASMTALEPIALLGLPHPFIQGACASDLTVQQLTPHLDLPGPSPSVRVAYLRADGLPAWNDVQFVREDGYVTWMHRDITQQIGTHELWQRYEFLVDTSQQFMALVSRDYTYELVNRSFAGAFATTPEEVNNSNAKTLWGRAMFNAVVEPHLSAAFRGEQVRAREWVELPVGGRLYLDMIYTPYKNAEGAVDHVVFVAWDGTREKLATDAVEDVNRQLGQRVAERTSELQDTLQELEAFNYTIAHDLRSPLRFLKSFTKMLADGSGGGLNVAGHHYVSMISQGVAEMQHMIERLLDFSRLSRKPICMERCDLNEVFESARTSIGAPLHIAPLPACQGDGTLLKQVVVNLLQNAEKFSSYEESPQINVYSSEAGPGLVRVCVEDNGIGFHMNHAEAVFAPFKQVHGQANESGNGLGLAIVRRIVERHGGKVWAESEEGFGARFYVELRACASDQSDEIDEIDG